MDRLSIVLAFLVVLVSLVSTTAFDWTFWKSHNDDETPASVGGVTQLPPPMTDTPKSNSPSVNELVLNATKTGSFIDVSAITIKAKLAKATTAVSDVKSTYRNWVGPRPISPDAACYREVHIMDTCPTNYNRNELTNTCWAECPISYPVECGFECIRQNDGCGMELLNKGGAIANTVLSIALFGAANKLWIIAKSVMQAMDCTNMMIGTMRSIIRYVRNIQTTDPQASIEKILNIMYQSHNVVTDLPMAYFLCMGLPLPRKLEISGRLLSTMNWILLNAIAYKDDIFSSWSRFRAFLIGANFTEAANTINSTDIGTLSDAMKSRSTCGYDLRAMTDRTWNTVAQLRADHPGISESELRLKMQNTQLMTTEIAVVTNNCMEQLIEESDEATAYMTRERIRTAFSGMVNELISTGKSKNGSTEDAKDVMYFAFSKVLISLAVMGIDLIGVMGTIAAFQQKVCGPTNFIGEIDDGSDPKTLGLTTIERAFKNSSMIWTRKGDGAVIVTFESADSKNVSVNIRSGGDKIDELFIHAGSTVRWESTVSALAGKTLYFDRWRAGFLGIPGTGGGSLLLWIPHASEGGHLEVTAKLQVS
ncbi:uncharacterized protein PHALS_01679 [Plasmopara halstedii]|uniref:RxLR-like protein n=1 Tax=Plasmopara halstedii TaxID=4781 RepID=A0A0P1AVL8_PLAHL|nr:uncharacterized protein PHALS_01679 [Plasmopara halstedii]CEG45377.1 hypothetical protein PHALS_01679 [Plasmopara halstedii]|eukprot:XP_024581746.1 hypothetical protein PHALS_01679 [Plasmopara halstedii]